MVELQQFPNSSLGDEPTTSRDITMGCGHPRESHWSHTHMINNLGGDDLKQLTVTNHDQSWILMLGVLRLPINEPVDD